MNSYMIATLAMTASCLFGSVTAFSAKKAGGSMSAMSSSKSGSSGRSFLMSVPVAAERPQLRLHLELNAADVAGIAIEGGLIGTTEELGPQEIEQTGNSMKVNGAQGSLLISRYSEPTKLGGFFWTLGGGYRQYTAEWKKRPADGNQETRLDTADSDGYLHHRVVGTGVVGMARIGYRYVASEWPFTVGGHVGLRHMNSRIKDVDVEGEEQQKLNLEYSKTNERERKALQNRMMTQPDLTLDVGLAF